MYEPAIPEHDIVEVPVVVVLVSVMLVGEALHVRPVEGEIVADSETVPARPWSPLTVIVDIPEAEARTITPVGFAPIVKS